MTLNDLLKRVDVKKDKDKMIIFSDGRGWCNINVKVSDTDIILEADTKCSPYSSDN